MEIQFFNYVYGCNQIANRIVLSLGDVKVLEIANSFFFSLLKASDQYEIS